MNRTQRIALAVLALFAALIVVFVLRNRQAPQLPADADHVWRGTAACDECHGPEGGLPRSLNHPIGEDCLNCHGQQR